MAVDVQYLHSSHCLASGQVMINCIGDKDGKAKGKCSFIGVTITATRAGKSVAEFCCPINTLTLPYLLIGVYTFILLRFVICGG